MGTNINFTLRVEGDVCIQFRRWSKFLRRKFLREFFSRKRIFGDGEEKTAKIRTRKNLVPHGILILTLVWDV